MLSRHSLLSLLLAGNSLAAAITGVTSTQIVPTDTCAGWPHWSEDPSNDSTGAFYFAAASATDSSVDGLRDWGLSGTSPEALGLIVDSQGAQWYLGCTDGLVSNYGSTAGKIYFSGVEDDQQLVYVDSGERLEIYNVAVNDVGLAGTYIGLGNITTWGFTFVPGPGGAGSVDTYSMRLLGADTTLGDDEIEGFLSVVGA